MILAIDTATRFMSIALHDGFQLHYEATWPTKNNHTIELAPNLQRALSQVGITPADLTAVAVSQGPGSFTGLRIGMGVAKGLATAQRIDLVAIPTLVITAAAVPFYEGRLIAVLEAGRGRVCAQAFEWQDHGWVIATEPKITDWPSLVDSVEGPTLFAGEIDAEKRAFLGAAEGPVSVAAGAQALRRAGFLAEMAWERIRMGQTDNPATLAPIYLHQPGVPHP